MKQKVSKSGISAQDIEYAFVSAILVKRLIRHFDVKLTLKGKQYIVPVVLDSSNQIDNFDFRNLPNISDEDCRNLLEKIETQIDQMPPLESCHHIKDDEDAEADFYRGTTTGNRDADKFFDDAIREYHDYRRGKEEKAYPDIAKVRGLIRSLPEDRQIFYTEFLHKDKFTAKVWDNLIYALHGEILRN
jgi:hypothetical protein